MVAVAIGQLFFGLLLCLRQVFQCLYKARGRFGAHSTHVVMMVYQLGSRTNVTVKFCKVGKIKPPCGRKNKGIESFLWVFHFFFRYS